MDQIIRESRADISKLTRQRAQYKRRMEELANKAIMRERARHMRSVARNGSSATTRGRAPTPIPVLVVYRRDRSRSPVRESPSPPISPPSSPRYEPTSPPTEPTYEAEPIF